MIYAPHTLVGIIKDSKSSQHLAFPLAKHSNLLGYLQFGEVDTLRAIALRVKFANFYKRSWDIDNLFA